MFGKISKSNNIYNQELLAKLRPAVSRPAMSDDFTDKMLDFHAQYLNSIISQSQDRLYVCFDYVNRAVSIGNYKFVASEYTIH